MVVTRRAVLAFMLVAGPLVLISYVVGFARAARPEDLWGGVTPAMQAAIVPVMLAAAAGFMAWAWILVVRGSDESLGALHWPWASPDGRGGARVLAGLGLFLLPSVFWLEATLMHLRNPQPWTPPLIVAILFLVALGNAMLLLLAFGAYRDGVPRARWAFVGLIAMAVQVTINDLVIWVLLFPW